MDKVIESLQIGKSTVTIPPRYSFNKLKKIQQLNMALQGNKKLEMLTVDACTFKYDVLEVFLSTLTTCPSLSWLFFTNNTVGDEGAKLIASKLPFLKSLYCINLRANGFSESSLERIISQISKCPTLQKIELEENLWKSNEKLENELKKNEQEAKTFNNAVVIKIENFPIEEYKKAIQEQLKKKPTLVNSRYKLTTPLFYLVKIEGCMDRLEFFLSINPNPHLLNASQQDIIQASCEEYKVRMRKYVENYQFEEMKTPEENKKVEIKVVPEESKIIPTKIIPPVKDASLSLNDSDSYSPSEQPIQKSTNDKATIDREKKTLRRSHSLGSGMLNRLSFQSESTPAKNDTLTIPSQIVPNPQQGKEHKKERRNSYTSSHFFSPPTKRSPVKKTKKKDTLLTPSKIIENNTNEMPPSDTKLSDVRQTETVAPKKSKLLQTNSLSPSDEIITPSEKADDTQHQEKNNSKQSFS